MQNILAAKDLAQFIDHTLLKPEATKKDIERLCLEAIEYQFFAVCVNPVHVAFTRQLLVNSNVLTASVIGFPLGMSRSSLKAQEASVAVADGAREIDMVIRIDLARDELWSDVERDIRTVVEAVPGTAVKVILETGLLDERQIAKASVASESAGAHFVKTATGFLGRGASLEDIRLMRQSCSEKMGIKASGGIKTFSQAKALIEAGATRLGTSAGVALVTGSITTTEY